MKNIFEEGGELVVAAAVATLNAAGFCTLPACFDIRVVMPTEKRAHVITNGGVVHVAINQHGLKNLYQVLTERRDEMTQQLVALHRAIDEVKANIIIGDDADAPEPVH